MARVHVPVPPIVGVDVGARFEHYLLGVSLNVLEGELVLPVTRTSRWANLSVIAAFVFVLGVVVYNSVSP